jgi:hypothetical protein
MKIGSHFGQLSSSLSLRAEGSRAAICALRLAIVLMAASLAGGCITHQQHPAATQPATVVDAATTQPSFWLDQPAAATVRGTDFDHMAAVCQDVARSYLFKIDRVDYRAGLVLTEPMISSQWFEPWRRDNHTLYDVEESSLATIRRSIRFEFTRQEGQIWEMSPKIIVERQTVAERRVTSAVLVRSIFAQPRGRSRATGSREADVGIILPPRYWIPVRRDPEFERIIAADVQRRLGAAQQ